MRSPSIFAFGLVAFFVGACGVPEFEFGKSNGGSDAGGDSGGGKGGASGGIGGSALGGSSGAPTGGAAGAGTGGGSTSCTGATDCSGKPSTPKCDVAAGKCVPCLLTEDVCPSGFYCTTFGTSFGCKPGCKLVSGDCPAPLACDPVAHQCLGCSGDADCPAGSICEIASTACVPGCTPAHPCAAGFDCCSGGCVKLAFDPMNCGGCGNACPTPPNGAPDCVAAKCTVKCDAGTADCNASASDGCEITTASDVKNCGVCGNACASGQTCQSGSCA